MTKTVKSSNKEINFMLKEARKAKWRCIQKGGHIKCYSPDGKHIIVMPVSTASRRAVKNSRAMFRKAGLKL